MTRWEHLEWAKERALKYAAGGDLTGAFASLGSDLAKHPQLRDHPGLELGLHMFFAGLLTTPEEMRIFIEDFQ